MWFPPCFERQNQPNNYFFCLAILDHFKTKMFKSETTSFHYWQKTIKRLSASFLTPVETIILLLLSALVERFFVSRMRASFFNSYFFTLNTEPPEEEMKTQDGELFFSFSQKKTRYNYIKQEKPRYKGIDFSLGLQIRHQLLHSKFKVNNKWGF